MKTASVAASLVALFCCSELLTGVAFAAERETTKKTRKVARQGLSGSQGDIKRKIMFPADWEGGCKDVYKQYVAASGHSAFAATNVDYFYGGAFVCGLDTHAGSQQQAEQRALAQCKAGLKKYKAASGSGACMIYSSK